MRKRSLAVLAAAATLLIGACGSGNGDEAASTPTPPAFSLTCTSPKPPAKRLPKLPAHFPKPDAVTYTLATKAGPSTILYGYYSADLTEAHSGWADAFKEAGYTITAEEQDPADAEVNFSGEQVTGQVRLQESCKGRSLVTVTIRPD